MGVSLIELWCGDIWSGVDGFRLRRNEVLYSLRKIEKKYPEVDYNELDKDLDRGVWN